MKKLLKNTNFFALFLSMAFLTISCSSDSTGGSATSPAPIVTINYTYNQLELEVIDLVNQHRKNLNLKELPKLNIISVVAKTHTDYMIREGKISHDNFLERADKLKKDINAKAVAENIAFGYKSAQTVLDGWLNSPTHKKQIENKIYTHTGICIRKDNDGKNYFTQIFVTK